MMWTYDIGYVYSGTAPTSKYSVLACTAVRVLYLSKGALNHGVLVHFPRMLILDLTTNIGRVAQQLELLVDVVIHLALEFAIRRHLTVEISASAHLHPRVPRVPRQPNTSPIA